MSSRERIPVFVPYIGAVAGLAWMLYLMIVATTEVHNRKPASAWVVFGLIFVLLTISAINAESQRRKINREIQDWQNTKEMTPEQAGEAMGEFLKGLQKGASKD